MLEFCSSTAKFVSSSAKFRFKLLYCVSVITTVFSVSIPDEAKDGKEDKQNTSKNNTMLMFLIYLL